MISGVPSCPNIKYEKKKEKEKKGGLTVTQRKGRTEVPVELVPVILAFQPWQLRLQPQRTHQWQGRQTHDLGFLGHGSACSTRSWAAVAVVHGTLAHQLLRCLWLQPPGLPPANLTPPHGRRTHPSPACYHCPPLSGDGACDSGDPGPNRGAYHPGTQGSHTSNTDPRGTDVLRRAQGHISDRSGRECKVLILEYNLSEAVHGKETKNLCCSATYRKTKERPLIFNLLNCQNLAERCWLFQESPTPSTGPQSLRR